MTTLAKFMIVAGGDNLPPMLDKTMYDSWESCVELYIEGKDNGRMMLNSFKNGPLIWPTVDEDGVTRVKRVAKDISDRVKLLMQGMSLSKQEREWRQVQNTARIGTQGNATGLGGNNAARQGKMLLVQAQENGQVLDVEHLAFLADPGTPDGQAAQITIPQNATFQTEDLDAYDSNCDDVSLAKVDLMANLSSYDSDVLFEVPFTETYHNDFINEVMQEM
ncbi:hypothetical protein Tco_0719518 [Tanacetum coccineum]